MKIKVLDLCGVTEVTHLSLKLSSIQKQKHPSRTAYMTTKPKKFQWVGVTGSHWILSGSTYILWDAQLLGGVEPVESVSLVFSNPGHEIPSIHFASWTKHGI
jgi:hypothetical protein